MPFRGDLTSWLITGKKFTLYLTRFFGKVPGFSEILFHPDTLGYVFHSPGIIYDLFFLVPYGPGIDGDPYRMAVSVPVFSNESPDLPDCGEKMRYHVSVLGMNIKLFLYVVYILNHIGRGLIPIYRCECMIHIEILSSGSGSEDTENGIFKEGAGTSPHSAAELPLPVFVR